MSSNRFDIARPAERPADPSLFDQADPPVVVPSVAGDSSIAAAFDEFHKANPWVYDALVKLARDMHRNGRTRLGIGMLVEVLRWQWYRATTDAHSEFKINNNYRSRYARLIMANEPDLEGVFAVRELHTT